MFNRLMAFIILLILFIPISILIFIATIDTGSFGLFLHKRVGLHGKPFLLFKIRTLKGNYSSSVTSPKMKRSYIGNFFRKYHLDEIPQLFNILLGDMNFVGPRPDTQDMYNLLNAEDYKNLTSIKPGITGITQIENFNEEATLAQQKDPENYYKNVLWPEKVKKNIEYLNNKTKYSDIRIIFDTLKKLIGVK